MTDLAIVDTPTAGLAPTVDISDLVRKWWDYLELEYSTTTRDAYKKGLKKFVAWLEDRGESLASATPVNVRTWREELKEEYSPATVNLWLVAVRRFYAFLIEQGIPMINPASIKGAKRRGKRHRRDEITDDEMMAIFNTCEDDEIGKRDKAILALMRLAGLRTVEVQRANLEDLQTKDGARVLWVQGKGHQEADDFVFIAPEAIPALLAWLAVRGDSPGALFLGLGPRTKGERLTTRHLRRIVKDRFKQAGVVGDRKTTHSLRHSAITGAIRSEATPREVMAMARHASYDTTLIYFHDNDRSKSPAEYKTGGEKFAGVLGYKA